METKQTKLKPFHIIIIAVMAVLAVALYLNRDSILPNPNAAYEELYGTFLRAEGTVVSSENTGGRRSRVTYTIQFSDLNGELVTVREDSWQTMPLATGEKVIIYYNPENTGQAVPESRWREITGK
jgi:hypothetical protein